MKNNHITIKYFQNAVKVRDELNVLIPNHNFHIVLNPDNTMWDIQPKSELSPDELKLLRNYRRKNRSLSDNK